MIRKTHITTFVLATLVATSALPTSASFIPSGKTQTVNQATATSKTGQSQTFRHKIAINQGKWDDIRYGTWTLPDLERNALQAMLIEGLQKSGQFVVMERETSAFDALYNEDAIGNDAQTPRIRQRRIPARYIVTPQVTSFRMKSSNKGGINIGPFKIGNEKTTVEFSISLRIVDSETGATIEAATGSSEQSESSSALLGSLKGIFFEQEGKSINSMSKVFSSAIEKAVEQLSSRLGSEPWMARVASVQGVTKQLVLNAGSQSGVVVGQEFDVFEAGEPVFDDETGERLTNGDEKLIGRIRIVRIDRNAAFGEIVRGTGFAVKNIVRPVKG